MALTVTVLQTDELRCWLKSCWIFFLIWLPSFSPSFASFLGTLLLKMQQLCSVWNNPCINCPLYYVNEMLECCSSKACFLTHFHTQWVSKFCMMLKPLALCPQVLNCCVLFKIFKIWTCMSCMLCLLLCFCVLRKLLGLGNR